MISYRQKLKDEIKAVGIAALYFGGWIAGLLFLKSLILVEYQIAFHRWSAAVVGALVLSKVVLVLEHSSLGAWVRNQPAWVEAVLRTAMYSLLCSNFSELSIIESLFLYKHFNNNLILFL